MLSDGKDSRQSSPNNCYFLNSNFAGNPYYQIHREGAVSLGILRDVSAAIKTSMVDTIYHPVPLSRLSRLEIKACCTLTSQGVVKIVPGNFKLLQLSLLPICVAEYASKNFVSLKLTVSSKHPFFLKIHN